MKTLKDMILKAADSANGLTYVWQGNEKYITYAELVSDARLTLHQMRGIWNNSGSGDYNTGGKRLGFSSYFLGLHIRWA